MTIELNPEQERILSDALQLGRFRSIEEAVDQAIQLIAVGSGTRPEGRKSLPQLFRESPLRGLSLDMERREEASRPVDL